MNTHRHTHLLACYMISTINSYIHSRKSKRRRFVRAMDTSFARPSSHSEWIRLCNDVATSPWAGLLWGDGLCALDSKRNHIESAKCAERRFYTCFTRSPALDAQMSSQLEIIVSMRNWIKCENYQQKNRRHGTRKNRIRSHAHVLLKCEYRIWVCCVNLHMCNRLTECVSFLCLCRTQ